MGVLNFPGRLPIALALVWHGESVNGSPGPGLNKRPYFLANEGVFEFTITGVVGGKTMTILRRATDKERFFADALNMYTTSPVNGAELEKLIEAGDKAKIKVDL